MRKQIIMLISLLLIVLLAGCSAQKAAEPAQTAPTKPTLTVEQKTETKPTVQVETKEQVIERKTETPPTVTVEPPVQISAKVQELLTKAETKVNSYKYLLSEPPENRFLNTYFIKGSKIKVKIFEGNAYIIGKYYDTVYLDTAAKTATARCEDERRCVTSGEDYTRKVFEANYDDFITKTPIDWLNEITNAELIGPEVVNGVSAMKIKTTKGPQIIEMWLHTTYGVPVKVAVTQSEQPTLIYQFTDSTFNHLKDSDVAPKFTTSQY